MSKRGQVTVFIIVGILVLFAFAGVFFLVSSTQKTGIATVEDPFKAEVTSFVESCLKEVAPPGIYLLAIQGGTINPDPSKTLITESAWINYAYKDGKNQLSLDDMEVQLNGYIDESLNSCLDDFIVFQKQGMWVIPQDPPKVETTISINEIKINLHYPLQAELGGSKTELDTFSASIPLRLGFLVQNAEKISEDSPASLDLFVSTFPFDRETTIFSINDPNSVIDNAPLTFMFAVQKKSNSPPKLTYVPNVVLNSGAVWTYQLEAVDPDQDLLVFSSNSAKVPVSADGLIDVTLTEKETFFVKFKIKDTAGLEDEQEMRVVVK